MIISVIHLSDIHFKVGRNVITKRYEKLFDSLKNDIIGSTGVIVLTSGDIAFSGKTEEYGVAVKLYKYLFKSIQAYTGIASNFVFVPGNHDVLFEHNDKIRALLLKDFATNGFDDLTDDLINICCAPQQNYFDFVNKIKLTYNGDVLFSDKLLKVTNFKFGGKVIKISGYNSAWHSTLKEKIGGLGFPVDYLVEQIQSVPSDLSISVVHHPFNWQTQETSKPFREFLSKTSEIIITGHEHETDLTVTSDLDNEYKTIHIASGALQDSDNDMISSFNVIKLNLDESKVQINSYNYQPSGDYNLKAPGEWKAIEKYKKLKNKDFQLKQPFLDDIENPGASFTHPHADVIKLVDLYVPCLFNNITITKEKKTKFLNFVNSSTVLEYEESDKPFYKVVFGNESSGKTALLKYHYLKYYRQGYYPIYINGESINEVKTEKIKSLLVRELKRQYDELDGHFESIDFKKIIILIDDFNKFKHKDYKPAFIFNLKSLSNKIIITGNELMQFESYTGKSRETIDTFDAFDRYVIQQFGPTHRNLLINKWYRLGKDYLDNTDRNDFLRKVDLAEENISTIIGKNLIPAYPVYMLSILQALEVGQQDTSNSLHGYYYEMLITKSLKNVLEDKDDIGFYMALSKEYFFFLFDNKIRFSPLLKKDFNSFLDRHKKKYNLDSINHFKILQLLVESKTLKIVDQDYVGVTYKYIYYYFVAKYLSDNLDEEDNKTIVDKMTDRVYRDEYSNIILFLSHLSRNKYIIDKLIEKSRKIFETQKIIKLESDVDFINKLQKTLPEQVIQNLDVDTARDQELIEKEKEEYETMEKEFEESKKDLEEYDLNEDINTIDILAQFTKAVRTINILGHITRKSWGELVGEYKMNLAEETYMLGLRTLQFNFNLLELSQSALIEHIKMIIQKRFIKQQLTKAEVENITANFVFTLSSSISFGLIKQIANSIGSQKLSKTFDDIAVKHPYNSINLINTSIKLDHYSGFPMKDVEKMKKSKEHNPLGFAVLQNLVSDHLYMYEVPYDKKQQICSLVKIKMSDQLTIYNSSPIKKDK